MTAFGRETRTARKKHACYWCGGHIFAGEAYDRWAWSDGGRCDDVKCHIECAEAWDTLSYPDNEEVYFGEQCRGCTCQHGRCECEKEVAHVG